MMTNEQKTNIPGMDKLLGTLKGHRSIRRYTDDPVTTEQLDHILNSAQMASSSSHTYSPFLKFGDNTDR
ncbi:nitroreductase family protein [Paenibacillus herberti]|uniref:Nitroreductase domain-containing protein n=1 Tax=Paenibacillus herberti TaxID=1619309 RepID=A0A229P022_9BACL|nr:nitroreductase family protein [Paenibacillus herberti]OXM15437.1 hypothetical protein CGZ75_01465 [Paenibacillus herberti]